MSFVKSALRTLLFVCLLAVVTAGSALAQNDAVVIIGSDGVPTGSLLTGIDTPRGTALDAENGLFFVSVTGGLGSEDGFVAQIDLATGVAVPFVTDVTPFDLEIDPASGDLFISDAGGGQILRTPTDVADPTVFVSGFTPSGLGFAPNGSLFAGSLPGLPPTPNPDPPGALFEVTFNPDGTGSATQVGVITQPFDVQVDSQGNVFANNGFEFPTDGEIAVFPGLGAVGATQPTTPLPSTTFSDTAIRGLAIGPNDEVFATTADLTLVEFDPLVDIAAIDPATNPGTVFAGPPVSNIGDPFAFDILFAADFPDDNPFGFSGDFVVLLSSDDVPSSLIPEPTGLAIIGLACVGLVGRRRSSRR